MSSDKIEPGQSMVGSYLDTKKTKRQASSAFGSQFEYGTPEFWQWAHEQLINRGNTPIDDLFKDIETNWNE